MSDNPDSDVIQLAEVVREVINVLQSIVQLPRERKKEWVNTLDRIIYEPKEN